MKNEVKESKFLEWYFQGRDDLMILAESVLFDLKKYGRSFLTPKKIFDKCGYIPSHICEDTSVITEYDPSEVYFLENV